MAKLQPRIQQKIRVAKGRITKRKIANKENVAAPDPKMKQKFAPKRAAPRIQKRLLADQLATLASIEMKPTDFVDPVKIGDGGFAVVNRAQMKSKQNMYVALKVIDLEKARREDYNLDELYTEGLLQHQLNHINISKLLGFYESLTSLVFVLEYYDNGDLYNYIKQYNEGKTINLFPITHERNLSYLRQLVQSVDYMHRTIKYIHMDVKPANMQITRDETLKLADFGCCVPMEHEREIHHKHNGGTQSYKPPEMLEEGREFDSTADSWSIGCIAFEMFSTNHKHPFYYKSPKDRKKKRALGLKRIKAFQETRYTNPDAEYNNMPDEVKNFLEHTIGANRVDRFLVSQLLNTPLIRMN